MNKPKSIHFVGIKGVGMAPLAIIAKEAGIRVTGSDIDQEFITDSCLKKVGITPLVGFSEKHINKQDVVITTGAHGGFDNNEVQEARKQGIRVITQGEAVGECMSGELFNRSDMRGISVTGSHGKTTTTALVATVLAKNGLDPSFLVGTGSVASLGAPGHYGKGTYFVAEADEYATEPVYDKTPKFLWQRPMILVFTNIELDHPDLYPTIDSIRDAFFSFTKNISAGGLLVAFGDDGEIKKILDTYSDRAITYGYGKLNDFILKDVHVSGSQTFFWVESKNASLGEFSIPIAGNHNALNALAAIIVGLEVGLDLNRIKSALQSFTGSKRRSEYVGKLTTGALVYDDYAHHPTEIRATLRAFRQQFPKKNIVCVFQPHTYSRTKAFFREFVHAFQDADAAVLTDIYPSLREEKDKTVSSHMLAVEMKKFHKNVVFLPGLEDVIQYVDKQGWDGQTVLISMGAGDVYKIRNSLVPAK